MGIGILIACALVHMLQPSSQELTNVCLSTEFTFNYSAYAFMFAMLAILLMQFIDFTVETILITSFSRKLENNNNGGHGNGISHAHDHIVHKVDLGSTHKVPVALDVIKLGGNAHTHGVGSIHAPCVHTGLISDSDSSNLGVGFSLGLAWNIATPCEAPVEECNKGPDGGDCGAHIVEDTGVEICSRASSTPVSGLTISSPVKTTYGSPSAPSPVGKSSSLDMTADCETEEEMSHGHSHNIILLKGIKRTIAAWLLEFGVSVHSILIGLTTGIVGETRLKVLLVALCFHQFFEGIALGSRIAEADMSSHAEEGFMVFLFSVSCPVGLAIGVGLTNAINPNGATYNYAAGIFDAICAGILLYIGLVLLINDFPKDMKKYCKKSPFLKFGMFVALWTGAGLLAYIGKYL
jgi:zinc transporter ZupT